MAPVFNSKKHDVVAFGDFQLYIAERRLTRAAVPVHIGSRSLDILIALITRHGEILNKDELIAHVWPNTHIDESALRVHISGLRKALDDNDSRLITNVPGRGYAFVGPIAATTTPARAFRRSKSSITLFGGLPTPVAQIIGRDDVIAQLIENLRDQRLVTVVGAGGIGKTTVALAASQRMKNMGASVTFIDLSPLTVPDQVLGAVASAMGLAVRSDDPLEAIAEAVLDQRTLLLLDSCEHVVQAAASLVENLLRRTQNITILATSREALRADGEWVHHLAPLALAPESTTLTADEAMLYPAVQMFVTRAAAVLGGFRLEDDQAPLVAEICRRLDGIALAIELATGRLDSMSIEALAQSLEHCFQVLIRGRRTALLRHQTLRGTFDWSFGFLVPEERALLRRLSVFNGTFSLDAAAQVASDGRAAAVEDALLNLVAKSLIAVDTRTEETRYRLLDTTQVYAREKLEEAGESHSFRRRHAVYYRNLFAAADATGWSSRSATDLATSAGLLSNLRTAIDWAFSPEGDKAIGVVLAADAVPLWFQLSLVDECLKQVQIALACFDELADPDPGVRMRLYAGLGFPQMRTIPGFSSGAEAWRSVLEIATALGDADYQARALRALWTDRANSAEARESLELAERLSSLSAVAPDYADPRIACRLRAWSQLMMGRLESAHAETKAMLSAYEPAHHFADVARFQYDQRSTARITLAQVLWLRGHSDQALWDVAANIAEMTAADHTLSLAHILSDAACFIALWCGDLGLAAHYVALLRKHTSLQALDVWRTYADCFDGEILIRQGHIDEGVVILRNGVSQLESGGFIRYHSVFQGFLAQALVESGEVAEAFELIDTALTRGERTGETWVRPELLRIRGEIYMRSGRLIEAEASFEDAFALAEEQGALAWKLRTAISCRRLRPDVVETGERLASVVGSFREGFDTEDIRKAKSLLQEICSPETYPPLPAGYSDVRLGKKSGHL